MEKIIFGNGCFWCTEAIFQELKGVINVQPGYSGGRIKKPTYKQVCSGKTGHAEVIQITFDPTQINFEVLLNIFFITHDPTTLNRQGNDIGTQYRSVIFYQNNYQKELAKKIKKEINESSEWENPIVTEIAPLEKYYPAENYHKDYYKLNGNLPYCSFVIKPKIEKFRKKFKKMLK